ncbi:SnoaL-like domain-containing protein [Chryseobacterium sp. T20]|uniref:SnoaL-like domain-containing protein n=1 Tax=Chryseobacterium sp. T20 TaxID=3395375 RepID=UPI0039BCB649
MESKLKELVKELNGLVSNGQLVDAAEKFYAPNVKTIEYDGSVTEGKLATMKKLIDFVDSIQNVKKIELLRSAADGNASFSEYILDFDMKDGSNVYLHEIIRALWEDGKVVEERYFKG